MYDKSAYHGVGDRAAVAKWRSIQWPLDLVILEGWMLGYTPVHPHHETIKQNPGMLAVNEALLNYSVWD